MEAPARPRPSVLLAILLAVAASGAVLALSLAFALVVGLRPDVELPLDAWTFLRIALATDVALLIVSLLVLRRGGPARFGFPHGWVRPTFAAFVGIALVNGIGTLLIQWTGEEYTGFPRLEADAWAILTFAGAVVVAPLCEELFFREVLLARVLGAAPATVAVAVSSALFGAAHLGSGGPILVTTLCAMGAIFAGLRLRTGSLGPPLLLHALNNAIALAFALLVGP